MDCFKTVSIVRSIGNRFKAISIAINARNKFKAVSIVSSLGNCKGNRFQVFLR